MSVVSRVSEQTWAKSIGGQDPKSKPEPVDVLDRLSYSEYLLSWHWFWMRVAAEEKAEGRCQVCNSQINLQVHHRTYARRGREALSDLTVLCRECHSLFHKYSRLSNEETEDELLLFAQEQMRHEYP